MKVEITMPDEFKVGSCLSYPSTPICPFARLGCWVIDVEKCPFYKGVDEQKKD